MRHQGRRGALALAMVVGTLAAPQVAQAYARTRTKAGNPAYWANPRVVMKVPVIAPDQPVGALASAEVLTATAAAGAIWSTPQVECTRAQISAAEGAPRDALVGHDKQNNLIFRVDSWKALSFDKDGVPIGDYEPNQLALTAVFLKSSGEIVDADIEINVFNHPDWEVSGDMAHLLTTGAIDLQNTLSHEMGHVLGFDHSCWDPVTGPQPLNGDVPLTACADDPALAEATMAPTAPPGDVSKRVLHADDRLAVCTVYPPITDDGGCAIAGGGATATSVAGLSSLIALALRRRRRRSALRA